MLYWKQARRRGARRLARRTPRNHSIGNLCTNLTSRFHVFKGVGPSTAREYPCPPLGRESKKNIS